MPGDDNLLAPRHAVEKLAEADDLKAFSDYISALSLQSMVSANNLAEKALAGKLDRPNDRPNVLRTALCSAIMEHQIINTLII